MKNKNNIFNIYFNVWSIWVIHLKCIALYYRWWTDILTKWNIYKHKCYVTWKFCKHMQIINSECILFPLVELQISPYICIFFTLLLIISLFNTPNISTLNSLFQIQYLLTFAVCNSARYCSVSCQINSDMTNILTCILMEDDIIHVS